MLLTSMGAARDKINEKPKSVTIKPRRGQRANTVIVKVMCSYDYTIQEAPEVIGWSAVMDWKAGDIKSKHIMGGNLFDITKETQKIIKETLIDMMGRVQEVDVIYKLPLKDIKFIVTFKDAMRSLRHEQH